MKGQEATVPEEAMRVIQVLSCTLDPTLWSHQPPSGSCHISSGSLQGQDTEVAPSEAVSTAE